jgi:solute:Na+ symporter, SSS family
MKGWVALLIILFVIIGTIGFGIFGVRRIKMNPAQFILGGRSFGVIFLWLLSAGEVYTSFTFLGRLVGRIAGGRRLFTSSAI